MSTKRMRILKAMGSGNMSRQRILISSVWMLMGYYQISAATYLCEGIAFTITNERERLLYFCCDSIELMIIMMNEFYFCNFIRWMNGMNGIENP